MGEGEGGRRSTTKSNRLCKWSRTAVGKANLLQWHPIKSHSSVALRAASASALDVQIEQGAVLCLTIEFKSDWLMVVSVQIPVQRDDSSICDAAAAESLKYLHWDRHCSGPGSLQPLRSPAGGPGGRKGGGSETNRGIDSRNFMQN